jgi:anaerobic selenocysteine-containing dehydrogenase
MPAVATDAIVKTTCGMCFAACGLLVRTAGGRVAKIEGDPESPVSRGAVCPKGLAAAQHLYHPDRLLHPLRRNGEKGGGSWKRVGWEEALEVIAESFLRARERDGPESVAFLQGSAKGLIDNLNERLANAFGTPNFSTTGHVCFLPRLLAARITCGAYTVPDYDGRPACVLIWGANLAATRIGEHCRAAQQLKRGCQWMVVDPVETAAARKARIWLRVKPGADLALALGLIHVIIDENLHDRAFVARHTLGFERLKAHLRHYDPLKVSAITWVPPQTLVEAARFYARAKPACIQWGNAIDHGVDSFQTARALMILRAITGNIGAPGGDAIPAYPLSGPQAADLVLRDALSPALWARRIDAERPLLSQFRRVPPQGLMRAILEERPYPVRCLYVHAANPLITHSDSSRTFRALKKIGFLAVADHFMTPTAALADIVLPAAMFLEYDSVVAPPYYPYAQIQQKAVAPVGECRSDLDIARDLAGRLGLGGVFWKSARELLDRVLNPTGMDFDEFRRTAAVQGAVAYRQFETRGFDTPSGKVELYSEALASEGFDPLPVYREPPAAELSAAASAPEYPLVLTSRKSMHYVHSGGRQIGRLRRRHPVPIVRIHPQTAAALSIRDGERVCIETPRGSIFQKAALSAAIDPRVVCADFGWWFPESGPGGLYGWSRSNLNILTDDRLPASRETGSTQLRGLPCRISPAET